MKYPFNLRGIDLLLGGVFALPVLAYGIACILRGRGVLFARDRSEGWRTIELSGQAAMMAGIAYLVIATAFILWLPNLGNPETKGLRNVLGWLCVVVAIFLGIFAQL